MLGAAALTSLSALRAGAGLVTLGIPKSLNLTAQRKISHSVMTWALPETRDGCFSFAAAKTVLAKLASFDAIAIGPGLGTHPSTQRFIREIVRRCPKPLVIDADGINALKGHSDILKKTSTPRILTPHAGEFSRITGRPKKNIVAKPRECVDQWAKKFSGCVVLLKGHRTLVAAAGKETYTNTTGNVGMATAGSGDVLTGMITAFLTQGIDPFDAAKFGAYLHGKAGDLAAKKKGKVSLIATDLIDFLPQAIRSAR